MTVRELGERMSATELTQWAEFADIEPFGSHIDDVRTGSITAALYNVNRDLEQCPEPFAPLDFCPWNATQYAPPAEAQDAQLDPDALSAKIDAVIFGRAPN